MVAAPGPSPKAGTEPTCFEAAGEVAEAADGVGRPSLCCSAGEVTGGAAGGADEVELRKRAL